MRPAPRRGPGERPSASRWDARISSRDIGRRTYSPFIYAQVPTRMSRCGPPGPGRKTAAALPRRGGGVGEYEHGESDEGPRRTHSYGSDREFRTSAVWLLAESTAAVTSTEHSGPGVHADRRRICMIHRRSSAYTRQNQKSRRDDDASRKLVPGDEAASVAKGCRLTRALLPMCVSADLAMKSETYSGSRMHRSWSLNCCGCAGDRLSHADRLPLLNCIASIVQSQARQSLPISHHRRHQRKSAPSASRILFLCLLRLRRCWNGARTPPPPRASEGTSRDRWPGRRGHEPTALTSPTRLVLSGRADAAASPGVHTLIS